jgi:hypothetical protein
MEKISSIATVPGSALLDENLSDTEFRLLTLIHSRSGVSGCKDSNASLGGLLGSTPATIRMRVESLLQSGWLIEVETGKNRLLRVCHNKMDMLEVSPPNLERDLFDPKNVKVSDKEINHLIAEFLKYKINQNVCRNAELMNMFYANPFNREGAKKLIREYGMIKIKDVLFKYADRMDEKFCPKLKSLSDLYKKWVSVTDYIDKPVDENITIVD